MANFKAGVSNGGVSGDSRYTPEDNNWPGGSKGTNFWTRGWGATEATPKGGAKEMGGMSKGKGAFGSKHKCVGCGG